MERLLKPATWRVIGWVLAGLGLAFAILMVLQPWRSCPDDDSAAGCPVTLVDANLTIAALIMMGAGVVLVLGAALRPRPPRAHLRPSPRKPDGS